MALGDLIKSGDTIKVSKSFGIVGSAVISGSKVPVVVVAANNNEQVTPQEMSINKPLVKMINVLASIDGIIKQRLENQKIISANERLARRESQIEQQDTGPQIEVIQPDAEKVGGSNVGLFALGGLALLALDPVQEALKTVFEGVASTGRFITGVVSSINDAFRFLLGSEVPAGAEPPKTPDVKPQAQPTETAAQAVPVPPAETPVPGGQAAPEEKPSFLGSIASGATGGAMVGSVIPRVGAIGGAIIGGAYGAYQYVTGAPSPSSSTPATPVTGSAPTGAGSSTVSPADATAVAGEIPKNDIVALGNYLASKGADKSQMEHPSLSGRVGDHSENSRHYRGMAIDVNFPGPNEASILDALEPQLRAAGYNTIWRKPGHDTHMHVSVGGPEGAGGTSYGDVNSIMAAGATAVGGMASASIKQVGELLGTLGSAIIKPGIPRTDLAGTISKAATEMNAEIAVSKTPKEPKVPTPPTPPNINRAATGATQNPATAADKTVVYYYLRRFGYQNLNTPEKALPRAVSA